MQRDRTFLDPQRRRGNKGKKKNKPPNTKTLMTTTTTGRGVARCRSQSEHLLPYFLKCLIRKKQSIDSNMNGENKDSVLDGGEAHSNGGGEKEDDGNYPTQDQLMSAPVTNLKNKNDNNSSDDSFNGKEDYDDDVILKQILRESLADNYGQETYSVEYDDGENNKNDTITTSSSGPDGVSVGPKKNKRKRRIVELSIGTTLSAPFDHHWDLSPKICRLDALRKLSVTSCRSLPEEIGTMKNLRAVTLIACKRMQDFPSAFSCFPSPSPSSDPIQQHDQDFHGTKDHSDRWGESKLHIEEFRVLGIIPLIPPFLLSRLSGLSKLRVLQYSFHALARDEELEYIRALTSSKNPFMISNSSGCESSPVYSRYAFESTLEELILNRCHLSTRGMEVLVMDVVPHYPKLKILSLCKNNIRSLKGLVADTGTSTTTKVTTPMSTNGSSTKTDTKTPPHRPKFTIIKLEEFILSDNPIWFGRLPFLSPYEDSDDENDEGVTVEGDGVIGNSSNNQQGNPQQQQQQQQQHQQQEREGQLLTPSEVRRRQDEQKEKMVLIQEQEQKNLQRLLVERAPFISYLGFRFEKSILWTPTVQHWLDVNKSCRKLLFSDQEEEERRLQAISARKRRAGQASVAKNDLTTKSSSTDNDDDCKEEEEGSNDSLLLPFVIDRTFRLFQKTDTIFGTLYGSTQRFRISPEMRSSNVMYYALRNSSVFLHPPQDQDQDQKGGKRDEQIVANM